MCFYTFFSQFPALETHDYIPIPQAAPNEGHNPSESLSVQRCMDSTEDNETDNFLYPLNDTGSSPLNYPNSDSEDELPPPRFLILVDVPNLPGTQVFVNKSGRPISIHDSDFDMDVVKSLFYNPAYSSVSRNDKTGQIFVRKAAPESDADSSDRHTSDGLDSDDVEAGLAKEESSAEESSSEETSSEEPSSDESGSDESDSNDPGDDNDDDDDGFGDEAVISSSATLSCAQASHARLESKDDIIESTDRQDSHQGSPHVGQQDSDVVPLSHSPAPSSGEPTVPARPVPKSYIPVPIPADLATAIHGFQHSIAHTDWGGILDGLAATLFVDPRSLQAPIADRTMTNNCTARDDMDYSDDEKEDEAMTVDDIASLRDDTGTSLVEHVASSPSDDSITPSNDTVPDVNNVAPSDNDALLALCNAASFVEDGASQPSTETHTRSPTRQPSIELGQPIHPSTRRLYSPKGKSPQQDTSSQQVDMTNKDSTIPFPSFDNLLQPKRANKKRHQSKISSPMLDHLSPRQRRQLADKCQVFKSASRGSIRGRRSRQKRAEKRAGRKSRCDMPSEANDLSDEVRDRSGCPSPSNEVRTLPIPPVLPNDTLEEVPDSDEERVANERRSQLGQHPELTREEEVEFGKILADVERQVESSEARMTAAVDEFQKKLSLFNQISTFLAPEPLGGSTAAVPTPDDALPDFQIHAPHTPPPPYRSRITTPSGDKDVRRGGTVAPARTLTNESIGEGSRPRKRVCGTSRTSKYFPSA